MQTEQLPIEGGFVVTPIVRGDSRGHFAETFRANVFEQATGHPFHLAQANTSFSTQGVVRGVHFALVPPGQAKYVCCLQGRIVDFVIDIRVGSPTFGSHAAVILDDVDRRAVYLAEGLGHAFCVLSETATVNYYCSTPYTPENEFGVNPLDEDLALPWPEDVKVLVSPKDAEAPSLAEARAAGHLPDYAVYRSFIDSLRGTTS